MPFAYRISRITGFVLTKNNTTRVETFQRLENYWDQELLSDMQRSATTVKSIDFKFNIAESNEEQISQIRSAIKRGVRAIIVNPYNKESLVPIIEEAYDSGVYVILVGQKIATFKYHAYAGIDNTAVGTQAAKYVVKALNGKGNIVVIGAFRDAPFYKDRFESFQRIIEHTDGIDIVGSVDSQWDNDLTHKLIDSLNVDLKGKPVDLIYSFGSMIIGAIDSGAYPNAIFVGTDGVPGECLNAVLNGSLHATLYNPTGGREAVDAAICLIKGMPFKKDNYIQPTLVTSDNAAMIAENSEIMTTYEQKIDILHNELTEQNQKMHRLSVSLTAMIAFVLLFAVIFLVFYKKYHEHYKDLKDIKGQASDLEQKYNELVIQKEVAEKMKQELEMDREELIQAGLSIKDKEAVDVISEAVFMKSFRELAEQHIDDSDYSIDQLAKELGVSRAQLFRKIKNESGSTPNDLLQSMRLEKGRQLLLRGDMNISEVSDAVGFTSASYFSKCYKDKYGVAPSDYANNQNKSRN